MGPLMPPRGGLKMPGLTGRRAIWIAALAGMLIYLPALGNRWALDDHSLIERNPAAHSLGAAWKASLSPYWPKQGDFTAGLYRPLTTLSYALDWTLSGGRPWWFHLTNLLLGGLATALAVAVLLRWLGPAAAAVAGVIFALHPVHVEAVANVVGRAELLVAVGLFGAVLAARRYRSTPSAAPRAAWFGMALACGVLALGSKEHGAIALGVLALDQLLEPAPNRGRNWNLVLAVAALTAGWLFLWRWVAGDLVQAGAAVPLLGLEPQERFATMGAVLLEVWRLLFWPFRLSHDYSPQTIPLQVSWSGEATVALVVAVAFLLLAVQLRRTRPAVTFAVLVAGASYLPTSNLLFLSGVVLAERTLYLAVLLPAVCAAWAVEACQQRRYRPALLAALALAVVALGHRTITRIPFWKDTKTVVIESAAEHPENFGNQFGLADALLASGDSARALAHFLVAAELFDRYPLSWVRAGQLALGLGRPRQALALGRRAWQSAPAHPGTARFLAEAYLTAAVPGAPDSALGIVRQVIEQNPGNVAAQQLYLELLERLQVEPWRRLLARARLDWLEGRLAAASARIDSSSNGDWRPPSAGTCWDLERAMPMLRMLSPRAADAAQSVLEACSLTLER